VGAVSERDLVKPNGIRAVFFDLDGTLSDYVAASQRALEEVWEGIASRVLPHGKRTFLECYWRVFRELEELGRKGKLSTVEVGSRAPRFERVLRRLGVSPDDALLDEIARLYRRGRLLGARLLPGARETLAFLKGRYKVGLITEGRSEHQRAQIQSLGIGDLLDHVVISHEVGLHKPDPALHRYALEAAGVAAGEAAMVGDRVDWDLMPAAALGMRTILFAEKNMYLDLVQELGFVPDWTVRNHEELRSLFA